MCFSTRCFWLGGGFKIFILLCVLWVVVGVGRGARALVVLVPPQDDEYFFPFLEVFLRRVLPGEHVVTIPSFEEAVLPEDTVVVMSFQEAGCLSSCGTKRPCILVGRVVADSLLTLGNVVLSWDSVVEVLRGAIPEEKNGFLFVGNGGHPLLALLEEVFGKSRVGQEWQGERLVVVEKASLARPFLGEKKARSFVLVVLEASTAMLFALHEGKVDFLVDTKPSLVAQCIAKMLAGKAQHISFSPKCCVLSPMVVTLSNIALADAYEVFKRCLSCH